MEHLNRNRESRSANASGYASEQYAMSLSEFGRVLALPESDGWLLADDIPNSQFRDGVGCYPIFSCRNWRVLSRDLDALAAQLISVRIVTDPFAEATQAELHAAFPEVCYEYKQHYITDLSLPLENVISSHHRRNVRLALRSLEIKRATLDAALLPSWCQLYDNLIGRHDIRGIAKFSRHSFAQQANVPGIETFAAYHDDRICGMALWYRQGDVAYYHLGAYDDRGYELKASYGIFRDALQYFAEEGIRYACLGAGAGVQAVPSGLTRFKQGWATHTRPAYFCGRIYQPAVYAKLACGAAPSTRFFPAYRAA